MIIVGQPQAWSVICDHPQIPRKRGDHLVPDGFGVAESTLEQNRWTVWRWHLGGDHSKMKRVTIDGHDAIGALSLCEATERECHKQNGCADHRRVPPA